MAFDGFRSDFYDILAHERTPNETPDRRKKQNAPKKTSGTNSHSGTKYFVPLVSGTKCQNQKSLFGHSSSIRYRP